MLFLGDAESWDVKTDDGESICTADDVEPWCNETAYDG